MAWSYTYDWGIYENLIPHPLYLVSHFLQDPGPPQVIGFNPGRIREAAVEEIRVLIPSRGASGEVTLTMNAVPMTNRLEIVGTAGRMMVDFLTPGVVVVRKSQMPGIVTRLTNNFSVGAQLAGASLGMGFGVLTGRIKQYMGLRALVAEFYGAISSGGPTPVTPEAGLLNVSQMEQIRIGCASMAKPRIDHGAAASVTTRPRVLVTGGSGFLGGRLTERLAAEGVPVRSTTRLLARVQPRPNVEWVVCDVTKEADVRTALAGIETVYHCAAMAGPPGSLEEYQRINVGSTVRLAELAAEAGVKTLVYVSSISVYEAPPRSRRYLDESAPYDRRAAERGFYTQTKLAADQALRDWAAKHSTPRVVMLRPGTIYGPGVKLPIGRFTLPAPGGQPLVAGGGGVPMPLVYVDNVVDAMLAANQVDAPTGAVFNVIDEPELNQAGVARALREVSHGRIRPNFLPYPIVWTMMLGVDLLALARRGKLGTARYRLERTLADMRYRCTAARERLGWAPRVSLAEGLTRVLEADGDSPGSR
jgi:nucleoside-diphosphate-sugar epimerase